MTQHSLFGPEPDRVVVKRVMSALPSPPEPQTETLALRTSVTKRRTIFVEGYVGDGEVEIDVDAIAILHEVDLSKKVPGASMIQDYALLCSSSGLLILVIKQEGVFYRLGLHVSLQKSRRWVPSLAHKVRIKGICTLRLKSGLPDPHVIHWLKRNTRLFKRKARR